MTADESPQSQASETAPKRKRRTPSRTVWIILLLVAVLVAIVQSTEVIGDHGIANIATLILGFVAVVTLAIWFFFRSGYARLTRLLVFACCVLAGYCGWHFFRIDHINGELLPTIVLRSSPKPDRLLPLPLADVADGKQAHVDLRTTTKNDFPGFLGPQRSESVDNVRLSRNWKDQPPQKIWRQNIGAGWSAFSVVNGHAVTMEQRGEMELTTCYNVDTGKLEWAHSTPSRYDGIQGGPGPRSTPTIDDGLVFALGSMGHLACLDGSNGKALWEKDLLKEFGITTDEEWAAVPWGRSTSPLVVGQQLIVPIGGRKGGPYISLVAFDKRSGAVLWKKGECQISYASPAAARLAGVEQILVVNEDTAAGHDAKTGEVLWDCPWSGHTNSDPNVSQSVPIAPDQVLLSKGYNGGSKLIRLAPAADGVFKVQVVWEDSHVLKTKFANVAVLDGYAYGLSDGILECVGLTSGVSKWKQGRYGHGQILRVGDLLLVLTERGEVVLVEATPDRPNHVFGRFQAIKGLTWNNIALYGRYLLVRNAEESACYKLPLEK
jgi:outer membrane protein assembly factor BamB